MRWAAENVDTSMADPFAEPEFAEAIGSDAATADFEAAIAWAQSMTHDENHRTLGGVYRAWLRHDRAAALEALSASSLTPTEQEAIRSR